MAAPSSTESDDSEVELDEVKHVSKSAREEVRDDDGQEGDAENTDVDKDSGKVTKNNEENMNSKELEELNIVLTYKKDGEFKDKVSKRLDRCRKKLNATKPRIYENDQDKQEDEKWIEDFRNSVKAEMHILRNAELTEGEKKGEGAKAARATALLKEKRKQVRGGGGKSKKRALTISPSEQKNLSKPRLESKGENSSQGQVSII